MTDTAGNGSGKLDRHGQAAILSPAHVEKILKKATNPRVKLIFQLGLYTGERWGAICQLQVADCYMEPASRTPRSRVLFRKGTRKGKTSTREVFVCDALAQALREFSPPLDGYLFPSSSEQGHISRRGADKEFRSVLAAARLSKLGISTHSTRRTFVTRLYRAGTDLKVIQKITGHKSLDNLMRYVEADSQSADDVVAALFA